MKFSCNKDDLLSGLQLVNRAIGSEQVLPILQNILIHIEGKRCTLSATNLEISIVTSFEVSIENEGSITVPARAVLNFMQYNQDDQVTLETSEGTQLKLSSKRAKAIIAGEAAAGFPTITSIQRETTLAVPIAPLLKGLSLVVFACAKTTSRPVISGVYVRAEKEKLVLVGTDSYRLSEFKIPVEGVTGEISCIIPARFLEELKAVIALHRGHDDSNKKETASDGEKEEKGKKEKKGKDESVEIYLGAQQVEVHVGPTKLISRLIEGKFPDYVQVLPKEKHTTVTLESGDLLTAVKRMHYFAKEQNNNITFSCSKGSVYLTTKQTQSGKDESTISATVDGKDNKIAISSSYLIDFLSRVSGETVQVELSDKMHPAVFHLGEGVQYLHLIMPLRMTDE